MTNQNLAIVVVACGLVGAVVGRGIAMLQIRWRRRKRQLDDGSRTRQESDQESFFMSVMPQIRGAKQQTNLADHCKATRDLVRKESEVIRACLDCDQQGRPRRTDFQDLLTSSAAAFKLVVKMIQEIEGMGGIVITWRELLGTSAYANHFDPVTGPCTRATRRKALAVLKNKVAFQLALMAEADACVKSTGEFATRAPLTKPDLIHSLQEDDHNIDLIRQVSQAARVSARARARFMNTRSAWETWQRESLPSQDKPWMPHLAKAFATR
jgi:hypothetical protein